MNTPNVPNFYFSTKKQTGIGNPLNRLSLNLKIKNMKFKIKVKHDKGISNLFFYAENEKEAIKLFLKNEDAPESAIIKIEPVPFYVTMTDKFMSGWGMAENKTNKFIVVCNTWEQAETIQKNAAKRNEMKYINICITKPKYGKNVVESWIHFAELGEIWKQN